MTTPFRVVVTAQEGEGATQASTGALSLADLDGLIEMVWTNRGRSPDYCYVSVEYYEQIQRAIRRAQKRAGTIAQKERAQWKRRHREEKQARAALALRYQGR